MGPKPSGMIGAHRELFSKNPDQLSFYTPFGGHTWLGYAAQIGKLDAVKTLVKLGLGINVGDKRNNALPVSVAASSGHVEVVDFFLKNGTDLDVSSAINNALFSAVIGRSTEIVEKLLDAGIDSKVRYNTSTMKNMDAIAFALMRGEKECARIIALRNTNGDEEQAVSTLAAAYEIADKNAS